MIWRFIKVFPLEMKGCMVWDPSLAYEPNCPTKTNKESDRETYSARLRVGYAGYIACG